MIITRGEYMKETFVLIMAVAAFVLIGALLGVFVHKDAIDSYDTIQKIIKECESTIPRNQHCEIVIDTKAVKDDL